MADIEPHRALGRAPELARHAGASLMLSACFRRSAPEDAITCLDCHDPHRNATRDPERSNASCLRCHRDPSPLHRSAAVEHGADCVACHMPRENEAFFGLSFTSHWIRVPGASPPAESPDGEEAAELARTLERAYREALAAPDHGPQRRAKLGMRLGKLLHERGRVDEGLAAMRDALSWEPLYKDRILAARYHERSGERARAVELLRNAIRSAPQNNRAYHELARLQLAAAELDAAEKVLDEWNAARPGDPFIAPVRRELERAREQARERPSTSRGGP
jgi:hypothetical protein